MLVVPAPAKVNLFLHVTGRRSDGYHDLESLMVFIDLADEIRLALRAGGNITRSVHLDGVGVDDDLCLRAARALARATGCTQGVDIAVDKHIPLGGGLGGGSSDAATVLLALNRLWSLGLARAELAAIGATLGADVPLFIAGQAAVARGIGERLSPVTLPPLWLALARPDVAVPTAAIFADAELTRSTPSAKMDVFSESYGRNDLQAVACARFPAVADAIAALTHAAGDAPLAPPRMTGSGACAFAVFAGEAAARAAVAMLPAAYRGSVVRTIARHPLYAFAA
jgi:4-diphosphocytidyl-2-C-methyl-D-erythritol kinase